MSRNVASGDARLIIPALGRLYASFGPLAQTSLRVIAGVALMTHGYGKILDPMGRIDMVEGLGFVPGEFWSPLLAIIEFFGGLFLACGFLTRLAALGTTIVLLVTVWFHWILQNEGYPGAEKSILWAAITFFFLIHGGGRYSVDRAIGRAL
ncbi:MAG: DoxX family protein [Gammaproteobacteria bacterium]